MAKDTKPNKEAKEVKPNKWSTLKGWQKALIIIVGIFVLMMIITPSGDTKEPSNDNKEDATIQQEEKKEVEEKKEEEKPKTQIVEEWEDVITVSGSSDKKTEPFKITGKRWKVVYTLTKTRGSNYGVIYIKTYRPGDSSYDDIVVSGARESGETVMYSKGELYLDISSANISWDVKVQQLVEKEVPLAE